MADTYTTTAGDTWDSISFSQYGSELYLHLLILENPAHAYVERFSAGIVLTIPELPTPDVAPNLPPWRRT